MFLEIRIIYSKSPSCVRISVSIKLQAFSGIRTEYREIRSISPFLVQIWENFCRFIKKETLAQVFSCEFCEISKSTFSYRTTAVAASVYWRWKQSGIFTIYETWFVRLSPIFHDYIGKIEFISIFFIWLETVANHPRSFGTFTVNLKIFWHIYKGIGDHLRSLGICTMWSRIVPDRRGSLHCTSTIIVMNLIAFRKLKTQHSTRREKI